jgi:pimeloyl-ACP methyl ester carboxylesterase
MKNAKINGIDLEYEITGAGEPLLLISTGPIADSFRPFVHDAALASRYRMIAYHQRGQVGTPRGPGSDPVSFQQHAADAAALLRHLEVERAHVGGHSTGAAIAMQLAVDQPGLVHTLTLLEPPLTSVPSAAAFFDRAGPALAAYRAGDRETAMVKFLSMVSGLDWDTCRAGLEAHVPGGAARAIEDADSFFAGYLAALGAWQFDASRAASIAQPVLAVVGTATDPFFAESHALLHTWFPHIEDCTIDGVGHLLHMQCPEPVLAGVGSWLARHAMARSMSARR